MSAAIFVYFVYLFFYLLRFFLALRVYFTLFTVLFSYSDAYLLKAGGGVCQLTAISARSSHEQRGAGGEGDGPAA